MLHRAAIRLLSLPSLLLFALFFATVALGHLTLLHLPYYWDEGGYYIPAALDFYHHGWLVPHFTNAHPPLPNVVLGTLWHLTGVHILATRLTVCAFAASALLAVLRLTQRLLNPTAAIAVTLLTAVYPIWYVQSSLAHADIFAATFTLWAFALYLPATDVSSRPESNRSGDAAERSLHLQQREPQARAYLLTAILFSLAALSKETAIIEPATLAALELYLLFRNRNTPTQRAAHLRWLSALSFPLLPLLTWYAYHHHVTGFTFGNPEYLRYNATANFTVAHVLQAIRYRFLHLFWQRNIWLPILIALACLFLPKRSSEGDRLLSSTSSLLYALILSNWLAFSILGGALLTRYLLPIYPLILILCVATWQQRSKRWPSFTVVTAAVFIASWWINPPTAYAPEDSLTYRDMVLAHQHAIDYVAAHYPDATVLTAWPVTTDLYNPELGYTQRRIKAVATEDFTRASLQPFVAETANTGIASYDTAIVFSSHFYEPALRHYLLTHPNTPKGREFARDHDLSPQEVAALLGGTVIQSWDFNGEWSAVLRFNRSYEAKLSPPRN